MSPTIACLETKLLSKVSTTAVFALTLDYCCSFRLYLWMMPQLTAPPTSFATCALKTSAFARFASVTTLASPARSRCLSLALSLSRSLAFSLSFPLSLSPPLLSAPPLRLSLSLSLPFLSLSLCLSRAFSLSPSLPPSLPSFLPPSLSLSLVHCVSPPLHLRRARALVLCWRRGEVLWVQARGGLV
jgi:hypothetical protein